MADIMEYLLWRGDITFDQSPFNDVDNLILSQIAYVNFDHIVPGIDDATSLSLEEASKLFHQMHSEKELEEDKSFIRLAPLLLKRAATTKRFKDIRLTNYVSKLDYKEEKQFSALHYELSDQLSYVAFRGTDDTLLGWKEDFNMSFMEVVPSQIEAVTYLNTTLANTDKHYYVGGHSKGGNLAIYSVVNCNDTLSSKVLKIYNNDGPGFNSDMLNSENYKKVASKITTFIPQSSFIGILLEHEEDYTVIKSKQIGFMQHDAMSWEVLGPHFVTCEELSRGSQILDTAFKAWMAELSEDQREQFIDVLYNILETTGAKTLTDLSNSRLKKINQLIKSYNATDEATKAMLSKIVGQLTATYYQVFKDSILPKSRKSKTSALTKK